jgi:hypothetical protein
MKIERAYTMANKKVRLQFLAMERSLRATGFDLPLVVFPYDENTFDLPKNSEWLHTPLHQWLTSKKAHPMCSKYFCLTQNSYLFTDTDIVYLRDPRETLSNMEGFVVADTEWNKPHYTFTEGSARFMAKQTSVWLQNVVNAGWFACDRQIYTEEKLRRVLEDSETAKTCLYDTDQTGLNLLLAMEGLKPRNLNLPPYSMEATWAGDYPGEFESLWKDPQRKPIFIHWAGPVLDQDRPINELFYKFLTKDEAAEWRAEQAVRLEKNRRAGRWPIGLRVLNAVTRLLYPAFRIQPRPR